MRTERKEEDKKRDLLRREEWKELWKERGPVLPADPGRRERPLERSKPEEDEKQNQRLSHSYRAPQAASALTQAPNKRGKK